MKRLSILFIAFAGMVGKAAAQEVTPTVEDSIIEVSIKEADALIKNLNEPRSGASVTAGINKLRTLRYQAPDPSEVVEQVPLVTAADSIAMYNDSISFMDKRLQKVKKDDVLQFEKVYLGIVNDFLAGETYMGGYSEVLAIFNRVKYDANKENFGVLLKNYETWLKNIARICLEAQDDLKANKRAWKNPNDSRAEVFVRQLENCSYYHREDKNWSVPYIEGIIQRAISRIRAYKTTQSVPMTFDDIIPAEFLPEKPKAENQSLQQTESTHTEFNLDNVNAAIQATKPNISSEVQSAESKPKSKPERFSEDAMQKVNDLLKEDKTKGTEAENPTEDEKTNASEEQ